MIAKLWAKRIIAGEKTINDVPKKLIDAVKQEIISLLNK